MDIAVWTSPVISAIVGVIVGVIGYFLKRTMSSLDHCEVAVQQKADRSDLASTREDLQKRMDRLDRDIVDIREGYITKEDFFREQAKTDRKLDMILDILMKGGVRSGN